MTRIKTEFFSLTEVMCPSPNVLDAYWAGVQNGLYQYRDTISIECNLGYTTTGPSIVTCGIDGRWSPGLPKCTLIRK